MSSPSEDRRGRPETVTDQDLLKVFDYEISEANPMLTAGEVTDALAEHFDIEVSREAVRQRLHQLEADKKVTSKAFGASATGWRALVGPRLDPELAAELDAAREELDDEDYVPLDS